MRLLNTLLALAAGTALATGASMTSAFAADAIIDDVADIPQETVDVLPPNYTSFVSVSFLYSFGVLDRDLDVSVPLPQIGARGNVDPRYALGGKVEAGAFVSDRLRFSVDARLYRTEFDGSIFIAGRQIVSDARAGNLQGFVNVAYEFALADAGITLPLLERSKLFGIAGLGATYLDLGETDDTAFTAKLGIGTVTDITDTIALVAETDYIFGSDFEVERGVANGVLENQEIISTIGLRFRF